VYLYVKNHNYQIQNFEKEAWKPDTMNAVYLHHNLSGDTNIFANFPYLIKKVGLYVYTSTYVVSG